MALVKFCFPRIVLNHAKISPNHPLETRVSRDAQNVCTVTKVGTIYNFVIFFSKVCFVCRAGLWIMASYVVVVKLPSPDETCS